MSPIIKTLFRSLDMVSPWLAGRAAHVLFTTPLRTGRLTVSEKRLASRADAKLSSATDISFTHDGKRVAAYVFDGENGQAAKTAVLVHGWMSGARYMLAMVDPLLAMGYRVVCFDLPAHGRSQGRRTNLVACAKALDALVSKLDGIDLVIAHSFGGAVTAFMLSRLRQNALGPDARIVLLASPNLLSSVTRQFAAALGLSDAARQTYQQRLSHNIGASLPEMDGNIMFAAAGYPLRVIHCVDDEEVLIEESRRYLAMDSSDVRLTELSGLGHRRILYHPEAIKAVLAAL
jgi:pimeloyl-ACP methyl ester carboxylesterase